MDFREQPYMAHVSISTANKSRTKHYEYVVVGDEAPGCRLGDIRWIQWDRNKSSPILEVNYTNPKERKHVNRILVAPEFATRGWRLLRDMYAEDPERSKHWEDFQAFAQAQRDNPLGMKGKEFPDEYLPSKVVEMRETGARSIADRTEFVFPTAKRAAEQARIDEMQRMTEPDPEPEKKPVVRKRSASPKS